MSDEQPAKVTRHNETSEGMVLDQDGSWVMADDYLVLEQAHAEIASELHRMVATVQTQLNAVTAE